MYLKSMDESGIKLNLTWWKEHQMVKYIIKLINLFKIYFKNI